MQRLLLRAARIAVGTFYRSEVLGEAVPQGGPLLLVANHPNGLVDPILIASATSRPLRFLGKAPLFELPVLGRVLRGLRVLPVHRRIDGADTAANVSTFDAVDAALASGEVVALFPEGRSHSEPSLQELRTGAARMALGAARATRSARARSLGGALPPPVRVVPIGLVYRSNRRFRSRVAVWVGSPIDVAGEAAGFRRPDERDSDGGPDDRRAVRDLTERIAAGLRGVTLNLDRWEDLPLVELAARIARDDPPPIQPEPPVVRMRRFAEGVRRLRREAPDALAPVEERVAAFRERLQRLGIGVEDVHSRYLPTRVAAFVLRNGVLLVAGLPLALAGAFLWLVPYRALALLPRLLRPNREVHATVQILAGLVLFPLWLALFATAGFLAGGSAAGFAVLFLSPLLGLGALFFRDRRAALRGDALAFLRLARRSGLRRHLSAERAQLASEIDALRKTFRALPPENPA